MFEENFEKIGLFFRGKRLDKRIKQRDLARLLEMSSKTLSKIERGKLDSVQFKYVFRLLEFYELDDKFLKFFKISFEDPFEAYERELYRKEKLKKGRVRK